METILFGGGPPHPLPSPLPLGEAHWHGLILVDANEWQLGTVLQYWPTSNNGDLVTIAYPVD